jgi:MFS family permease
LIVFVVGVVLLAAFVARCGRTDDPVLDLDLLRKRFFASSNLAALVFSAGFFAMIFVNVQFLNSVWHYDVTGAGLAIAPGPAMAAVFAAPAGRYADRIGHRWIILPGTLLFAAGIAAYALWLPSEPAYWTRFFPVAVITGIGVGLTISTFSSASSAFLPSDRFAMGSAFNATVRQIGAALGIAVAVAILGDSGSPGDFDASFVFIALASLVAGLLMLALYKPPIAPAIESATTGATVGVP